MNPNPFGSKSNLEVGVPRVSVGRTNPQGHWDPPPRLQPLSFQQKAEAAQDKDARASMAVAFLRPASLGGGGTFPPSSPPSL